MAMSVPAQEGPLYQPIRMAYAREIAFRKRVEKLPPKLGPPRPPRPGFIQRPPSAQAIYRYDVREGDHRDIFEFGPDIILKNGSVYTYRNGLESH